VIVFNGNKDRAQDRRCALLSHVFLLNQLGWSVTLLRSSPTSAVKGLMVAWLLEVYSLLELLAALHVEWGEYLKNQDGWWALLG